MILAITAAMLIAPAHYETEIVKKIAPKYNSKVEVRLWDDSRCDMVGKEIAWEVDWAKKWAEGVGQALYYSILLNKKPGVVLLTYDRKKDQKYIYRAQTVCAKYGIRLEIEELERE